MEVQISQDASPADSDMGRHVNFAKSASPFQAACADFFSNPIVRNGLADHGEPLHRHFAHCNLNDANLLELQSDGSTLAS
jgi:acyl-CoA thioesterase FadM